MKNIHPTAIIEDGAILENGVIIGPNVFISEKSKIGANTQIMQGSQILGCSTIGKNCKIYSYAIVGADPQDVSFAVGEETKVIIGDDTRIREFVTINGGSAKGDFTTKVGKNCFIMNFAHVAHDCIIEDNVILANGATLAGHVEIGRNSVVGGMTPIHQFVKVGRFSMVAGASALNQDVPPFCLAEGNRAYLRGLNLVGLRRNFEKVDIDAISSAYKKIFKSSSPIKESAQELLETQNNENVKLMCEFVLETKRGINFMRASQNE